MINLQEIKVGTIIQTKKPHPCGSDKWLVERIGVDFKLKCMGCSHEIMIERIQIAKRIKKVINNE